MKILVVEDHAALARISCDLLRDVHGHDVAYAATGQAALGAAATFLPDLVLIDLNLPDISGYELATQLRAQPRFDRTVLVGVSAFGATGSAAEPSAGALDVQLRKPMDFAALAQLKRKPV